MPSFSYMALLALAFANDALSLPGPIAPITKPPAVLAQPTVTPHHLGGLKKRQNPDDIVATYGTGSVLSKLYPAQLANATAGPNEYCSGAADPQEGIPQTCECAGANPTFVPINSISGYECAYTVVPGRFTGATTATPTSTPDLNQPCTQTDESGVVWAYTSEELAQVPGYQVTITQCAGDPTAVSTVASIAAEASEAADFANGWCGYVTDNIVPQYGVLIPNWMGTFDFDTANNDFRGSLFGNSACNSFSSYSSAYGGPDNTTFGAKFWATDFCTAWQVTQVIKATTGGAYNIPCHKVDKNLEVHPEAGEVPPGESIPEEPPLEIEPEKRAMIPSLTKLLLRKRKGGNL